ncbi:short chain dehydrogenase/reductase [Colletotrichum scovillei]|uniref:NADPH-dependent 1-acyldihydroxyacetone phosphate reductase n=1 Tax=Colletotrichum scovillei TaxID=1209932 RepID=A0A9P7UA18_9PEZI|nr:short chain dehydrogenase/reductase [Colletotrichum scovillei]KAF4773040.1 short chain dehydrogenase/reductase [Colletotrichum scovillei]KAG7046721.1 NADPH-dependent 1-acyldihydroxyacetone phosphate reductase [Colletotrichum scovillei]KAG7056556.1 NADPH-dependent 1-acyldihydroxyacetone phosphate reductase [Colletotrichum scovillei]KAG7066489.1 NADPH-dependent 1-acyldihydroxyacetone phosphate reductase [Colletotrichum scovillei]
MDPRPRQKTVLVTGCSPGGIGHALCQTFRKQGLHVIATARKEDVIHELVAEGFDALQLDVTSEESIVACHKQVQGITGGKLDILVNNAGRIHISPATDLSIPDVRATFETNVFGVMAMVKAFADHLIAAQGLIINVSSCAAVTPYMFASVYCASKGAIASYSRTLRQELRPFGVRVMVVVAGTVKSRIADKPQPSLALESLYARMGGLYERYVHLSQEEGATDTEVFAEDVVGNALRPESWFLGRPDWLWCGGMSRKIWWALQLFGEWVIDWQTWKMFGLEKLQRIVQDERFANGPKRD